MYAKCGSMDDANRMVNSMPSQSVVSWAAMILGHMKCRQGQDALELFEQMQQEGVQPNSVTFVAVLNACARVGAVEVGRHVHEQIIQSGCESDVFVRSSWVTCMQNVEAWRMLEECSTRCHLKIWSVGQP